ncbi:hypothetical protein [Candidatus Nitrotoga arctica]|uniref:hypothetical protein n=1 Tax=Candidatus Nitrotoga arctica TaxID=453162 RepID=UPI001EFB2448|nr:hypothetical protein [Candidatus Nitrotoga arctica]
MTTRQKTGGVIYTISVMESVNMNLANKPMDRGLFLSDEALLKLLMPGANETLVQNGRCPRGLESCA